MKNYDTKPSIPNKLLNEDGTITDISGNEVTNAVDAYKSKPAIPNKVLNPDGTYSTLTEVIGGGAVELFVLVEQLPASGDPNKIYVVPSNNKLLEYHWTGTKWDPIGMLEFDISQYSTTEQMNTAIANYVTTNTLTKTNTTAFTPSADYNPATKKYVDDTIAASITDALNESY